MAMIPLALGGRPLPRRRSAWLGRWLGRGWLAALGTQPPDPAASHAGAVGSECASFVDLFTRYHLALIEYLYGMTRDRELAADLAQDAFTRAYAAAPDLAGIAEPRAWLYRIA